MEQVKNLKTGVKFKDTPVGKIPVNWEVVHLKDVCDEIYRYPTYYNIKYVEQNQGVPEVRGELIKNNGELSENLSEYRFIAKETSLKFPRTILQEGDFVISVRGTMGKIGYISKSLENANMTANLMRISPNRSKIFPQWQKQFFLSDFFQARLNEASSATTIKTIKAPELKAIELALPPLPEQKKIAEFLSTVDEAIEKTAQIIEKTKQAKKGLMQKLLTRGINHKKFKKTELGEIPVDWKVGKLIDCAEINMGQSPPGNTYNREGIGQPILNGPTEFTDYSPIPIQFTTQPTKVCKEKDILFCVRGSSTGRMNTADREYCIGRGLAAIRAKSIADTRYIYYMLLNLTANIFLEASGSGSTFPNISREALQETKIAIPPLLEQKKIAHILSSRDEEIKEEIKHKDQLESLKKGLMQVLLTGKIRVTV